MKRVGMSMHIVGKDGIRDPSESDIDSLIYVHICVVINSVLVVVSEIYIN